MRSFTAAMIVLIFRIPTLGQENTKTFTYKVSEGKEAQPKAPPRTKLPPPTFENVK